MGARDDIACAHVPRERLVVSFHSIDGVRRDGGARRRARLGPRVRRHSSSEDGEYENAIVGDVKLCTGFVSQ